MTEPLFKETPGKPDAPEPAVPSVPRAVPAAAHRDDDDLAGIDLGERQTEPRPWEEDATML